MPPKKKSPVSEFSPFIAEHKHLLQHFVVNLQPQQVSLRGFCDTVCLYGSETQLVFGVTGSALRRAVQLTVQNWKKLKNGCPSPPAGFNPSEQYNMKDLANYQPLSTNTRSRPRRLASPALTPPAHTPPSHTPPSNMSYSPAQEEYDDYPGYDDDGPSESRIIDPNVTPLTLYINKCNPLLIIEHVKNAWTDDTHRNVTDMFRLFVNPPNPQDAFEITGRLHSDRQGADIIMRSVPWSRRTQEKLWNAAIEQQVGPCEQSAKQFGVTVSLIS